MTPTKEMRDFEARGLLASLTFWHRLSENDSDELAAFLAPYLQQDNPLLNDYTDKVIKQHTQKLHADGWRLVKPSVPDQMQDWGGMDGAIAFHLIERHAQNWADTGKMMAEWLAANQLGVTK